MVYKRGKDKLAPAELKKVHPLGKSPVITVKATPTSETITLAESGTMTEYLSQYFAPHLIPKRYKDGQEGKVAGETEEWIRHFQLIHYAEGSLMSILVGGLLIDGKHDVILLISSDYRRHSKRTSAFLCQANHQQSRSRSR